MHAVAGMRPHAEQHDGEDAVVPPARMRRLGRREESLAEGSAKLRAKLREAAAKRVN